MIIVITVLIFVLVLWADFILFPFLQNYFIDRWNLFDFIIVVGSIVDITMNEVSVSPFTGKIFYTRTFNNRFTSFALG